jgi:hypothetical protein
MDVGSLLASLSIDFAAAALSISSPSPSSSSVYYGMWDCVSLQWILQQQQLLTLHSTQHDDDDNDEWKQLSSESNFRYFVSLMVVFMSFLPGSE